MSRNTWTLESGTTVEELGRIRLGNAEATRFRMRHAVAYTGDAGIDGPLSTFEVAVAAPPGRPPADTPVVIGLEAIATPYTRCGYLASVLLEMGIACVLFETPLSGTRSLAPHAVRNPAGQLAPLAERGFDLSAPFMGRLMHGVAGDVQQIRRLAAERFGLTEAASGERLAHFGISLGCLLSSFAFMHEGSGNRLLGVIGHADAVRFARGFSKQIEQYFGGLPLGMLLSGPALSMVRPVVEQRFGKDGLGALHFARMLHAIGKDGKEVQAFNPIRYAGRVAKERRVRFLVGEKDPVALPGDAERCAEQVPDGAVRVKKCLAHGWVVCGPPYEEVVSEYVRGELRDWA